MLAGELSSFCLYAVLSAASLSNMSGFFVEIMKVGLSGLKEP